MRLRGAESGIVDTLKEWVYEQGGVIRKLGMKVWQSFSYMVCETLADHVFTDEKTGGNI